MFRLIFMLAIALCLMSMSSNAYAGRFTCKAAQNLARVAALDRDAVIVEPDETKKECRFSINGEPAGSPPRALIVEAANLLRFGKPSEELTEKNNSDWLGFLLLAASTDTTIDDSFRQQLRANSKQLANCFRALEANTFDVPAFRNENGSLFCSGAPRGGAKFELAGKFLVEVESAVPFLVVGAMHKESASYLFVPFGLFRSPPPR
jgi:hypothetical protein